MRGQEDIDEGTMISLKAREKLLIEAKAGLKVKIGSEWLQRQYTPAQQCNERRVVQLTPSTFPHTKTCGPCCNTAIRTTCAILYQRTSWSPVA